MNPFKTIFMDYWIMFDCQTMNLRLVHLPDCNHNLAKTPAAHIAAEIMENN